MYEIIVKGVKRSLRKILGNSRMMYQELDATLVEKEVILHTHFATLVQGIFNKLLLLQGRYMDNNLNNYWILQTLK